MANPSNRVDPNGIVESTRNVLNAIGQGFELELGSTQDRNARSGILRERLEFMAGEPIRHCVHFQGRPRIVLIGNLDLPHADAGNEGCKDEHKAD